MSNYLLKQLENLRENELYTNMIRVCDLALTTISQKTDLVSQQTRFQITVYYADAFYNTKQYLQAENLYRQSLQLRKSVVGNKNSNNKVTENFVSCAEIKYRIYLCCVALKQKKAATDILQTVPARQRTPKIFMALGNIYKENGMERCVVACFKEVLRMCPMAVEAMESLLQVGVKGIEVNALLMEPQSEIPWLANWIKAQAQINAKDFHGALQTYRSMDTHGILINNPMLLVNLGYCYHYLCEDTKAIEVLHKAVLFGHNQVFGIDLFATLLAASGNKKHQEVLEDLSPKMDISLWQPEHWVVLGNLMYLLKKFDRAIYMSQQALCMNRRNVEALLLAANVCLQLKKYEQAISHCNDALEICSFRYDIYKCLVDCYVQTNRLKEADGIAFNACQQLNRNAWGYYLHASVLLAKDPLWESSNICKILEKAIAQDKNHATGAVYLLAERLIDVKKYSKAVDHLLKALEVGIPTSRLHQLLGDCYVNMSKEFEAFNHYSIALKLDSTNQRAEDGLNALGGNLSISKRENYYNAVEDRGNSSNYKPSTPSDNEVNRDSDNDNWNGSNGNGEMSSFE